MTTTIPDAYCKPSIPKTCDTQSLALNGGAASLIESLWQPRFPSVDLVNQAADLLPGISPVRGELTEGPRPFIRIGPGVIEVRSKDYVRADHAAERKLKRHQLEVDSLASYIEQYGVFPDDAKPVRCIASWSRKSRANMVRTLGLLDFTPMYADRIRIPAMVTLTYPGDWLTVAPTGRAVKRHLKMFRKRYERAWGEPLRGVWKLEFQHRGAPHIHMLMVPPHGQVNGQNFASWLSLTWAAVVAHPNPEEYARHLVAGTGLDYAEGLRASDPKRIAVYFTKHSTFVDKEYQHAIPEEWQTLGAGPGRFWGYWGLDRHAAVVEVDQENGVLAGRTLRRWAGAKGVTREVSRPRVKGGRVLPKYAEVIGLAGAQLIAARSKPKYRSVRTKARRMRRNRGFVMVNDGAAMASQLARYLKLANTQKFSIY